MELKETTNLSNFVEKNVEPLSEKNDANYRSGYDILFPEIEEVADLNIENDSSHKYHEKPFFGAVSTMDWLTTWRPLENSYASSPEPGK